jgi:hypothetical protein
MIFLGNLIRVTDTKYGFGLQHNMPLDPVEGIRDSNGSIMTEEQLNQIGILVDSVPEPNPSTGQRVSGRYVNPVTKEITYDYEDIPLTQEQKYDQLRTDVDSLIVAQLM